MKVTRPEERFIMVIMETLSKPKAILSFLFLLVLLAACSPTYASTPAPATVLPATDVATPTAIALASPTASTSVQASPPGTFTDPFAYCSAVDTIDQPDARYTGSKTPEAVVKGLMKASGAPADAPVQAFSQGTFWRCMDKQVYACFAGANLPCDSKANTSQTPTAAMNDYCKANPSADFIPAAITGHDTIYAWACKTGAPVIGSQVFHVDSQGYIREIWYAITP
jgi:hypothetical protein